MPHSLEACRQRFPLFVSQDGTPPNQEVANLVHSLGQQGVRYLHHMELQPPKTKSRKESLAYYRIANHYKFIMQTFLDCFRFPRLIILEVRPLGLSLPPGHARTVQQQLPLKIGGVALKVMHAMYSTRQISSLAAKIDELAWTCNTRLSKHAVAAG